MPSLALLAFGMFRLGGSANENLCGLPIDALTVFGIRPGATSVSDVQVMLGQAPKNIPQEAASLESWCYELQSHKGPQFVVVDSDDFAGANRVSEIRLTSTKPSNRLCDKVVSETSRRLMKNSPIGRSALDLMSGLPVLPIVEENKQTFESKWVIDKSVSTNPPKVIPYYGRCALEVEARADRVVSWRASWREEG